MGIAQDAVGTGFDAEINALTIRRSHRFSHRRVHAIRPHLANPLDTHAALGVGLAKFQDVVFAQQKNIVGKKDFARVVSVAQMLHFRDNAQMLADGHAVVANGAGVIAAERAMVRASARGEHRVVGVFGEIVKTTIDDRQIIQRAGLGMSGRSDDFARGGAEQQAGQGA